jgi:hypothetical protein
MLDEERSSFRTGFRALPWQKGKEEKEAKRGELDPYVEALAIRAAGITKRPGLEEVTDDTDDPIDIHRNNPEHGDPATE